MAEETVTKLRRVRRQHWRIKRRYSLLSLPTIARDVAVVLGMGYIAFVMFVDALRGCPN